MPVVSHSVSTSNHNEFGVVSEFVRSCISFRFYIKPQLRWILSNGLSGCISFRFYIKPQLPCGSPCTYGVVSHSVSTSNHNMLAVNASALLVVSHSVSTSNHNLNGNTALKPLLYLIPFLHQTTTNFAFNDFSGLLYLIPFLHQTTTRSIRWCGVLRLYLIPFLHQTTTFVCWCFCSWSCISFRFYIKPQLKRDL